MCWPRARKSPVQSDTDIAPNDVDVSLPSNVHYSSTGTSKAPNIVQNNGASVPDPPLPSITVHNNSRVQSDTDIFRPGSNSNGDAPNDVDLSRPSDVHYPSVGASKAPNIVQNNDAPVPDPPLPSIMVHNNDAPVPDSPLPSTVEDVTANFPQ